MSNFWPQNLVDWAQVLGAIGTCGAVIVSLWLARPTPPKLKGSAGIFMLIFGDGRKEHPEYLGVRAVNVSTREAVVTMLGWRMNHWRRRKQLHAYQDLVHEQWLANPTLPARMQQGQEVQFCLPFFGRGNWIERIEESGMFPDRVKKRADLEDLRAVVYTTVGKGCAIKPDKSALDRIWEAHRVALAKGAGSKRKSDTPLPPISRTQKKD